jgi:hypothetical protein
MVIIEITSFLSVFFPFQIHILIFARSFQDFFPFSFRIKHNKTASVIRSDPEAV